MPATGMSLASKAALSAPSTKVEVVLHTVCADHVALTQRLQGQSRGQIGNADKLHILLHRNAVCQALTDGAVTSDAYFNLSHNPISF